MSVAESTELLDMSKLSVSSVLCVYAGMLATLSTDTLACLSEAGQPLLEHVGLVVLLLCNR